jgi:SAM-dependent methyltransferase
MDARSRTGPDRLLKDHLDLLKRNVGGPVMDLACGNGHNGLFLARQGLTVILVDRSEEVLREAELEAARLHLAVEIRHTDLETMGTNPLEQDSPAAILVFRYLHRPLFPCIRKSLRHGGLLIYETFTSAQATFGKPRNPAHLLKPGELLESFRDWEVIHYFEGLAENPRRAIAQLICRKPV